MVSLGNFGNRVSSKKVPLSVVAIMTFTIFAKWISLGLNV